MGITKQMFTSNSGEWETPQWLFDMLNEEFHFNLDVCATKENAKCKVYFDIETDGLKQEWHGTCWMNPPYGREIGKWIKKAYEESQAGVTVVCLIPARTDTKWWHDYVMKASEIRLIRGRLGFVNRNNPSWREDGNFKISSAPFPSAIVVFRRKHGKRPVLEVQTISIRRNAGSR